jgi:hypothetical protein
VPDHRSPSIDVLGEQILPSLLYDPIIELFVAEEVLHVAPRHRLETLLVELQIIDGNRTQMASSAVKDQVSLLLNVLGSDEFPNRWRQQHLFFFVIILRLFMNNSFAQGHLINLCRLLIGDTERLLQFSNSLYFLLLT